MVWGDGENRDRVYLSPLNSVPSPPGKDRKGGYSPRSLVLARLEWPNRTEIIPAVVIWASRHHDRVLVEWHPDGKDLGPARQTWLFSQDVRPRLDYPRK